MFSGRVPSSFERGPWALRFETLRKSDRPLIDLTDHNPTNAGLLEADPALLAALAGLASHGALHYEPDPLGLLSAREAVVSYYADHGAHVTPDQVVLTTGTSEAYAHAFRLLADASDSFLVPRPSYPLFEPLAAAEAVRLVPYGLRPRADGSFDFDVARIGKALRDERASAPAGPPRGLVVVQPNHPTGSLAAPDEVLELTALCGSERMALIADEVFLDYANDGGAPTFAASADALVLVFSGLSKVCGLPQLKCGWIVVTGPPALRDEALERLAWLSDAFLTVGAPVQHALPALLEGRHAFQTRVRERVAANRLSLAAALASLGTGSGASLLPSAGGWSAVLAFPGPRTDEEWALSLLEHDVVVHPGYFYDFEEPGRVVMSLLPAPSRFDDALSRFVDVCSDLRGR